MTSLSRIVRIKSAIVTEESSYEVAPDPKRKSGCSPIEQVSAVRRAVVLCERPTAAQGRKLSNALDRVTFLHRPWMIESLGSPLEQDFEIHLVGKPS